MTERVLFVADAADGGCIRRLDPTAAQANGEPAQAIGAAGRASWWSSTLDPMRPYRQSRVGESLADGAPHASARQGATQATRFDVGGPGTGTRSLEFFEGSLVLAAGLAVEGAGNDAVTDTHSAFGHSPQVRIVRRARLPT